MDLLEAEERRQDGGAAAKAADLRYVTDDEAGLCRKRWGGGFTYLDAQGRHVRDESVRKRIEDLVIPPAWSDVWICRTANGHIQATGRDDAGRKQYIYHPRWREVRDRAKFEHLVAFAERLPRLRRRVRRQLANPVLDEAKVTAAMIRLMDLTLVRVGSRRYAKERNSYGLTTLRDKHVHVTGDEIDLSFAGKGGSEVRLDLRDETLAAVVRDCQDIPGYELFQYADPDGGRRTVDSGDINAYLQEVMEHEVTAKDFRTWGGTVRTARALHEYGPTESDRDRHAATVSAVKSAAELLGNTPATCRGSYVHPRILGAYEEGRFPSVYEEALQAARTARPKDLRVHEAATLTFLRSDEAP